LKNSVVVFHKKAFLCAMLMGFLCSCQLPVKENKVIVSVRQIAVNDVQYTIKGICYHPVSKGKENRSFENLTEDMALLVESRR